jgi:hypothetical protein
LPKAVLAINFADQVNPAQLSVTRETVARLPLGQLIVLPGGYGHLGIFHAKLWAEQSGSFLNHLPAREPARPLFAHCRRPLCYRRAAARRPQRTST